MADFIFSLFHTIATLRITKFPQLTLLCESKFIKFLYSSLPASATGSRTTNSVPLSTSEVSFMVPL